MRTVIIVLVAAVFGAAVTLLGYHLLLLKPKLAQVAEQRNALQEDNARLEKELVLAQDRVQFMELEAQALMKQVAALQGQRGLPGEASTVEPSAEPLVGEGSSEGQAIPQRPTSPPQPAPRTASPGPQSPGARKEEQVAPEVVEQRRRIEEILLEDVGQSTDPIEQRRLQTLHDHLKYVRDLYRDLQLAATPQQSQTLLNAIADARGQMKTIVRDQRRSLMRKIFESEKVSDPQIQQRIIESIEALQETNHYWKEPLLIWGMAAPEETP